MTGREVTGNLADSRAAAFVALADSHLEASYRLARVIMGEPAAAEDATHDALVTAWRKWSTLRDPDRFEHWFDRILVHTCRNHLKRSRRWSTRDVSAELALRSPDEIDRLDEQVRMRDAVLRLDPDQRVVVALRYYRDLPIDDIAARLNLPPGTVKSRLHRALRRLEEILSDGEPEGPSR